MLPPRNNIKKFKNIPFVWENENYLLKMKSDTSNLLQKSHFSQYFNFSIKNDPFLVYPSMKGNTSIGSAALSGHAYAQGSGANSLKKLKGNAKGEIRGGQRNQKLSIPL